MFLLLDVALRGRYPPETIPNDSLTLLNTCLTTKSGKTGACHEDSLMTVDEVARELRVNARKVYQFIQSGELIATSTFSSPARFAPGTTA